MQCPLPREEDARVNGKAPKRQKKAATTAFVQAPGVINEARTKREREVDSLGNCSQNGEFDEKLIVSDGTLCVVRQAGGNKSDSSERAKKLQRDCDAANVLIANGIDISAIVASELRKQVQKKKKLALQRNLGVLQSNTESLNLLTIPPEILVAIIQHCDAKSLSLLDQLCTIMSIQRPKPSLVQQAVNSKRRAEYPSMPLYTESCTSGFSKIEECYKFGNSDNVTDDLKKIIRHFTISKTEGIAEALKLSNNVLKYDRIRFSTMILLAKMVSADMKHKAACAKIIMHLSFSDRDAVVAAGALPVLIALLLQPEGSDTEDARIQAARAIWTITKASKYQELVVKAGTVDPLLHILKTGSLNQKLLACRTLYMITHGPGHTSERAIDYLVAASVADQLVLLLLDLSETADGLKCKAALAAASLLCSIVHNMSLRCKVLNTDGIAEPLLKLLRGGPDVTRAFAAQTLIDIATDTPSLQAILIPILCQLLDSGIRMIDWFDVASELGAMVYRSKHKWQGLTDVVVRPLVEVVKSSVHFASLNAEHCVLLGLATMAKDPHHISYIVQQFVSTMQASECGNVKTRIAFTFAAIARTSHQSRRRHRDLTKNFHSTAVSDIDPACLGRMMPSLVQLLVASSPKTKKHSADCLGLIANEIKYIDVVVTNHAISPLMLILGGKDENDVKQCAAMAIGNIATKSDHASNLLNQEIAGMSLIKPLVDLLEVDCDLDGGQFAAMAISTLSFDAGWVDLMVKRGVVGSLALVLKKSIIVPTAASSTPNAVIRQRRMHFTQASIVIALLAISGSAQHCNNQECIDALRSFNTHLSDCAYGVKFELATVLLVTIERQGHKATLLKHAITAALLSKLTFTTTNSATPTTEIAKEATIKLYGTSCL